VKEEFYNYRLIKKDDISILKYSRSTKDWIDLLLKAILAIASLLFLCIVIYSVIKSTFEWYHIIIPTAIFIGCIYIWLDFISSLIQPTGKILSINKIDREIRISRPFCKTQSIKISDIRQIEYTLIEDIVSFDSTSKFRYHTDVVLVTNKNEKINLLIINPSEILDLNYNDEKKFLRERSTPLVKAIAKEMGVLSKFNGLVKER